MPDTTRDEFLRDVFVTACEGGINYWAYVQEYSWSDPDRYYARVLDVEDDGAEYVINRALINRGLRRIHRAADRPRVEERGTSVAYLSHSCAARISQMLRVRDAGELDADDADVVVQVGLFGEVRYA